jgi:hypothetical protein
MLLFLHFAGEYLNFVVVVYISLAHKHLIICNSVYLLTSAIVVLFIGCSVGLLATELDNQM